MVVRLPLYGIVATPRPCPNKQQGCAYWLSKTGAAGSVGAAGGGRCEGSAVPPPACRPYINIAAWNNLGRPPGRAEGIEPFRPTPPGRAGEVAHAPAGPPHDSDPRLLGERDRALG